MSGRTSTRRAGRPVKPLLTRGLIADAALSIVTDAGIDGLTMKSLAARLGVSVSSLYNHIAGKAELLASVQDAVMSRVDASAFGALTLQDAGAVPDFTPSADLLASALRSWSRSYRQVFADYPSLVPLIATMPVTGAPATRRMYDAVAAGLLAAGVPSPQVVPVIVAFESFLYGSAMDVHAPAGIFGSQPEEQDAPAFRAVVASFTAEVDGAGAPAGTSAGAGAPAGTSAGAGAPAGTSAGVGAPADTSAGVGAPAGTSAGVGAPADTSAGASAGAPADTSVGAPSSVSTGASAGASADTSARIAAGASTSGPISPNPYADQPFEWGLDALVARTLTLLPE